MNNFLALIKKTKPIGLILLVLLVLATCVTWAVTSSRNASYLAQFEDLNPKKAPASGADKVIIYLNDDESYSKYGVPEKYLPEGPEDVAVVVYLTEGSILYGRYDSGVLGYVRTAKLQWFDLKTQKVLAETTLEGGTPPRSIKSSVKSNQYGSRPSDEKIGGWIQDQARIYLK